MTIVEDRIAQAPHRGRVGRRPRLVCKHPRDFDRSGFDRVIRIRLADQAIRVRRGMDDEEPFGDISGRLVIKPPHPLAIQLVVLNGMGPSCTMARRLKTVCVFKCGRMMMLSGLPRYEARALGSSVWSTPCALEDVNSQFDEGEQRRDRP